MPTKGNAMLATLTEMLGQGTIIMVIMIAIAIKAAMKNPGAGKAAAKGVWILFRRFMK
jgi:hypothetical protein